ncbi:MAG: hypothetical protein ACKO33_00030 [Bacteroidota bacterium]
MLSFTAMLKIYLIGVIILIAAILLNGLINKLGVLGWYDFINLLIDKQTATTRKVRLIDMLWLFIAYPFLLGLAGISGNYLYNWLFQK